MPALPRGQERAGGAVGCAMSTARNIALGVLATSLLTYLGHVFVLLEPNVFKWTEGQRVSLIYLSLAISWFAVGLPYVIWRKPK
jgi:hypothetical protein